MGQQVIDKIVFVWEQCVELGKHWPVVLMGSFAPVLGTYAVAIHWVNHAIGALWTRSHEVDCPEILGDMTNMLAFANGWVPLDDIMSACVLYVEFYLVVGFFRWFARAVSFFRL